jgi:hypothetical protein
MAKRDFIYDTKAGRISLGVLAVVLIVLGLVLLVLCVGTGREYEGFWWTLIMGVSSVIFGICNLNILKKRKMQAPGETAQDEVPETAPAPAPESLPGEPDVLVVINPTRVNEPDGALLLYRKEGVLVYDGRQIPIARIVDASVTNANSNPYLPPAYSIRLTLDDKSIVLIPTGLDGEWAQEALKQLQEACSAEQ